MTSRPLFARVVILFVPLALLLSAASLVSYRAEANRVLTELVDQSREGVRLVDTQIRLRMELMASDIRYLARSHALADHLWGGRPVPDSLADLETDWREFSRIRGIYDQIRLIDASGMERVRVDYRDGNVVNVPPEDLQSKVGRYYFHDSMARAPGEIYASRLDLNIEHGEIERPFKPMMRVGTPVVNPDGTRWGIVLVNYLGRDLLDRLSRPEHGPIWLVDDAGYWMRGPDPEREWGFMFGRETDAIGKDHPQAWQRMLSEQRGHFEDQDGIWVFRTVWPQALLTDAMSSEGDHTTTEAGAWKIIDFIPAARIADALAPARFGHGVTTLALLAGLLVGAIALARAMAAEGEAKARLEEANRELELRVAVRTQELADEVETRRKSESLLAHKAAHDALTGLSNRQSAERWFGHAVDAADVDAGGLAMAFVDLDNFKLVNDNLGHDFGDELLRLVARRLSNVVRSTDLIARYGGDEFLLLLRFPGDDGRLNAALQRFRNCFSDAFEVRGHRVRIEASFGVALYPADAGDWNSLLKASDAALYAAKRRGRGQECFFTSNLAAELKGRFELEGALREALRNGGLSVHFQPKLDAEGRIRGFEALARWTDPTHGAVPPDRFIPVAEETGLIAELGRQVLMMACREAAAWQPLSEHPVSIAVNLASGQFVHGDLIAEVEEALAASGLPSQLLELEVTESALMQDKNRTVAVLAAFRERGIRISVDDFGTGYSSLSYLRDLPIDGLKIDRSFVNGCEREGAHMTIPHAVIFLGKSLELRVTAEGVERVEQFEVLRRCGCDEFQGYWIARPLPAAEARALLLKGFHPDDWPGGLGEPTPALV
ncbi:MAG: EAL domain-containing protein [Rhodocyclaceae bacterium]|nr:EAL domain-containing protein [Rhodocyclaceae bacterium]